MKNKFILTQISNFAIILCVFLRLIYGNNHLKLVSNYRNKAILDGAIAKW